MRERGKTLVPKVPSVPSPMTAWCLWECPRIQWEHYIPMAGGGSKEKAAHATAKLNVDFGH